MVDVELVIPAYNEERGLTDTVRRVHDFLTRGFPYTWTLTIAENGSTDATAEVADLLASQLPNVHVLHLERSGRGHALRAAWSGSEASVVAYMDADLSTGLSALHPLVSALLSGHSEVAIGTRLAHGSRVIRGAKRELISYSYNRLLKIALHARFSDAQCGFKAVRGDVVRSLLEQVEDDGWFFDTELLIAAQRAGMRVHEVPVDWVDDPDSKVAILRTAADDLRGVIRLANTRRQPVAGTTNHECQQLPSDIHSA